MSTPTRPRVLLVDDRPDNLLALRSVLDPLAYDLVEVSSGEEALRRLLEGEFALIVLDVQMPVLDGFETARLIKGRERTRHVPIIFLTAISGAPEHYLQGYETGAVDYVYKPFEPQILRAKVAVFAELWQRGATIARQRGELADQLDELNRAHGALTRQAAELERSNAALEQFATVASHDVREPLHTVAGLLDLLLHRHGAELDAEALLLAERAVAGTGRAAEVVGELLAHASAATDDLMSEPVSLDDVVEEARTELAPLLGATGGLIVGPGGAGEGGALPKVLGDRRALVRLVVALGDVLLRRHAARRVRIETDAGAAMVAGRTRLVVTAEGSHADAAEVARLFTVWDRGVDLSLCRRIVERHGGDLHAEVNGDGAIVVRLELPAPGGP